MNETMMAEPETDLNTTPPEGDVSQTRPPEFITAPDFQASLEAKLGTDRPYKNDDKWEAVPATEKGFQDFSAPIGQSGDESATPQAEVEQLDTGLFAIPRQELIDRLKKCKSIGQHTAGYIADAVSQYAQLRSDLLASDLPEEEKAQMDLSTAADLLKIVGIGEIRANRIAAEFGLPEIDTVKSNPPERPEDQRNDDETLIQAAAEASGVEIDEIRAELEMDEIRETNFYGADADQMMGGKVEQVSGLPEDPTWPKEMQSEKGQSRPMQKLGFRQRIENLIRGDIRGFFERNQKVTEQEKKDFSTVEDPKLVSLADYQSKDGEGPELKNELKSETPDAAYTLVKEPSDFDLQPAVPQETTNQADYILTEIQTKIDRSSLPAPKRTWLRNALLTVAAAFTLNSAVDQVARPLFDAAPIIRTGDMAAAPDQEDQSTKEPQVVAVPPSLEPVLTQQQEPEVIKESQHWWEKWLPPKTVAPEEASVAPVEEPAIHKVSEKLPAPTEGSETAPIATEFETVTLRDALWNYIDKSLLKLGVEASTAKLNAIKGLTQALNRIAGLDVDFSRVGNVNSFSVVTRVDQLGFLPLSSAFTGTGLVISPDAMANLSGLFDLPESSSVEADQAAHQILVGLGSGSLLPENLTQEQLKAVLKQALSITP